MSQRDFEESIRLTREELGKLGAKDLLERTEKMVRPAALRWKERMQRTDSPLLTELVLCGYAAVGAGAMWAHSHEHHKLGNEQAAVNVLVDIIAAAMEIGYEQRERDEILELVKKEHT